MKKITYLLFLLTALTAISCAKTAEFQSPNINQDKCLKGVIDDVRTKTTLSPVTGGYNLLWNKGDRISVYDGKKELFYKAAYGGSTETIFVPLNPVLQPQLESMFVDNISAQAEPTSLKSESEGIESRSVIAATSDHVIAYYPLTLANHILPEVQDYVEDDVNEVPMVADYIDEETALHFRPICGILRLCLSTTVPDVKVKAVNISADQGLSGSFSLIDGNAIVYGEEGVTLDCGEGGIGIDEKVTPFHIVLPVNTYSGMTVRIYTTDDKVSTFKLKENQRYTVNPAELRTLDVVATNFTDETTWTEKSAKLMEGIDFSEVLKRLSGSISSSSQTGTTSDSKIKKIIMKTGDRSTSATLVSSYDSEVPVYAEYDKASGTITVKTAADKFQAHKTASNMFYSMTKLEEIIGLDKLEISETTDASYMFYSCSSLKTLHMESMDISRFSSSGVFNYSFAGLNSLETVYLGEKGYNKTSFRPSNMWCTSNSLRTGSSSKNITFYCTEVGAAWLANTDLRWVHSGYSGKTPVSVKFYDWQDNTKEYTPVWAAD